MKQDLAHPGCGHGVTMRHKGHRLAAQGVGGRLAGEREAAAGLAHGGEQVQQVPVGQAVGVGGGDGPQAQAVGVGQLAQGGQVSGADLKGAEPRFGERHQVGPLRRLWAAGGGV